MASIISIVGRGGLSADHQQLVGFFRRWIGKPLLAANTTSNSEPVAKLG